MVSIAMDIIVYDGDSMKYLVIETRKEHMWIDWAKFKLLHKFLCIMKWPTQGVHSEYKYNGIIFCIVYHVCNIIKLYCTLSTDLAF